MKNKNNTPSDLSIITANTEMIRNLLKIPFMEIFGISIKLILNDYCIDHWQTELQKQCSVLR